MALHCTELGTKSPAHALVSALTLHSEGSEINYIVQSTIAYAAQLMECVEVRVERWGVFMISNGICSKTKYRARYVGCGDAGNAARRDR